MNTGKAIRKILFVSMWLVIGAGMVTLLAAAMRKQNNDHCRDYLITIKGKQDVLFVDAKEIESLLMKGTNGNIKGQAFAAFNLHELEQLLKNNAWVKDADLYFDNRDVLHISVIEREPVARIITTGGSSCYIDGTGKRMPLSDKISARVPVFTGFPEKKLLTAKDSSLLQQVKTMAQFILNDPFWMAQVSQVDITPERNFEMIPVVGNHVVKLGNGEAVHEKFHRLFIFYNQVLSKAGFEKYRTIDVEFAGQVVASKQTGNIKVDTVQLRKNVEKLLQQAREAQKDTVIMMKPLTEKPTIQVDSATASTMNSGPKTGNDGIKSSNPNPLNSFSAPKSTGNKNTTNPPKPVKQPKPKAVMPKPGEDRGY